MTSPLDLSRSELRSLVTKAARGAGKGWGLAEEAGWAADWLARRGLPAADWALDWLSAPDRPDPVALGLALAERLVPDSQGWPGLALPDDLAAPGYLLPFLHRIALRRGPLAVAGPGGRAVHIGPEGHPTFGPAWPPPPPAPLARVAGWTLAPAPALAAAPLRAETPAARPAVAGPVLAALDLLALHTTVPPSDSSRRDAGALAPDDD